MHMCIKFAYIYTDPVTCFFFSHHSYLNFSLYANDTVGGVAMVGVFMCLVDAGSRWCICLWGGGWC